MMRGKYLAQAEPIKRRWIERGKAPQHRGHEVDLFHIDLAVSAGGEMEPDPVLGQDGKVVV